MISASKDPASFRPGNLHLPSFFSPRLLSVFLPSFSLAHRRSFLLPPTAVGPCSFALVANAFLVLNVMCGVWLVEENEVMVEAMHYEPDWVPSSF